MVGRILELTRSGLAVHKRRGFIAIEEKGQELGRLAIEDIEAVLASSPGLTWSSTALAELSEHQVPVMFLGQNFAPVAVVLPLNGHHAQAERFRAQADASLPFRKQAWATLVRHKIAAQAKVLDRLGLPCERLNRLTATVRSGDPDNREAQAAQAYWPLLMGKGFRPRESGDKRASELWLCNPEGCNSACHRFRRTAPLAFIASQFWRRCVSACR